MGELPDTIDLLPCVDSSDMAESCLRALAVPRELAAALGRAALVVCDKGCYVNAVGKRVDISELIAQALASRQSIPPGQELTRRDVGEAKVTKVQVCNETTLQATRRLVDRGQRPLALNFANGVRPGGGFLNGALAQEEVLCRSSALYITLEGDPMYEHHRANDRPESSDWVIHSPAVPVFRSDDGAVLDAPWLANFLTCAAPYAPKIGQPESGDLLGRRILRVLEVAHACGYQSLVLGAWGCGAFRNDPLRTAQDFRAALENEFMGCFSEVVFAVTDWSPERRFLGPFRDVFSEGNSA